jgi:dienelactone hydrolase
MNNIREYLCREARRITDASVRDLPATAAEWYAQRPQRWKQFMEMMGIPNPLGEDERPPLNVRTVRVLDRAERGYRVEVLCFESLPRLYVTANLYLPAQTRGPSPAVVYLNGHSYTQKLAGQYCCQHLARLGFVTIVVDTIEYREMFGTHHGPYSHGQYQWYSRGYTPAGVEMWNAIRAVNFLQSRPEVDSEAIGAMGCSGGGAATWWLGAGDERVKALAPNCATGTLAAHIAQRTVDGHCDCMFFVNTYQWDLADVGALIAPRPLLISAADRDGLYSIESVRECYERIKKVYRLLGAEENVALVETPGPHGYHEVSRKATFAWFLKHLKGEDVSIDEVPDADEDPRLLEKDEDLLVFPDRVLPPDERTTTVHDWFVPRASAPVVQTRAELEAARAALVRDLESKTFAHFPPCKCDLAVTKDFEWEAEASGLRVTRLSFTPEEGWRLPALLAVPKERPSGKQLLLLHLVGARSAGPGIVRPLEQRVPAGWWQLGPGWIRLAVAVRGVDESTWGDDLAWHVRRASAIIGRTVASMRVYDALRALEWARSLHDTGASGVILSGAGEMAVVALYAALLDGGLQAVVLADPPTTQDAAGQPDGAGDSIEMLNVLRFTDLPYVAGLLWPTKLIFLEPPEHERSSAVRPTSYVWAEDLYARLGPPGSVSHIKELSALRV